LFIAHYPNILPPNFGSDSGRDTDGAMQGLHAKIAERRLYARWFDDDRLRDKLRLSGTPKEECSAHGRAPEFMSEVALKPPPIRSTLSPARRDGRRSSLMKCEATFS
jgi:hypothetical protein